MVAWLHERGGFQLMLQAFGGLCVLVVVGAFIFPSARDDAAEHAVSKEPRSSAA